MLNTPLHHTPLVPRHSVDIARKSNDPPLLVITRGGVIRLSYAAMTCLHYASRVLWKYLGTGDFNLVEADEWESHAHPSIAVLPPRPEKSMNYFCAEPPAAYRVGVIAGDYSQRVELSQHEGRGVVSVFGAIDKDRLHRVW